MKIELTCAECGGNNFPIDEASSNSGKVAWGDCDHAIATLAELQEKMAEIVLARAATRPRRSALVRGPG